MAARRWSSPPPMATTPRRPASPGRSPTSTRRRTGRLASRRCTWDGENVPKADGNGNACDADIDGDGLTNGDETSHGTNPLKADTDGDGRRDGVDVCPRTAGKAPNGCPDTKPPPLKLGKRPKKTVALAKFLHGLKATAIVGEVARLDFELRAKAHGASLAPAAYN